MTGKRKDRRKSRYRWGKAVDHLPLIRIQWEDHMYLDKPGQAGEYTVVDEVGFLLKRTPKYTIYAGTVNKGPGKEVDIEHVTQVLNRDIVGFEHLSGMNTQDLACTRCGKSIKKDDAAHVLCGYCWWCEPHER